MAFAIAIVYVNKVTDSIKHNIYSDPNTRYSIYKKMHNEYDLEDKKHFAKLLRERIAANKYVEKPHPAKSDINQALPANVKKEYEKLATRLESEVTQGIKSPKMSKNVFDRLPVEFMRWVFNSQTRDEEIEWLNYLSRRRGGFLDVSQKKLTDKQNEAYSWGGYDFLPYTTADAHDKYYNANKLNDPSSAEATKAYNDADFWYELKRFNIPNDKAMRYWITMTAGQVCYGISKQGSSMIASLGIPTTHFGQPGHSAYFGFDSTNQETKQSDCKIENALDNNAKTIWHSKWDKSTPTNKVVVDFEFKNEKAWTSFSYTPRQNNEVNGIITKAILYKVVEGKSLEKVADLNWANDRSIKTYFFTNDFKAQHLKLIIVQANNNFASAAEFAFSEKNEELLKED